MSCNCVILIGNLVEEPELKYTPNGTPVGKLRIAVDRTFNRDESDFFTVVTWRKTAENCANHLKKGSQVCVEGRLQVRSYENNEGQKVWVTEVIAEQVHFLGSRPQGQQAQQPAPAQDNLDEWNKLGREVKPGDLDMFDGKADDEEIPF
jgi:single-strand DNA-binding protein